MNRAQALAAALVLACGCGNAPGTDAGGPTSDSGIDAQRDCLAVCVRSATSPCECMFPCGGHLTTATCNGGTCDCVVDGTPTMSYAYTSCGPDQFIPGCHPELSPDAGADAGPPVDAGRDAAASDASLAAPVYTTETRTISSGGATRSYLLARPTDLASRGSVPLVFSFHGDGGSAASMRSGLPLEAHFGAATAAVFVYPESVDSAFEYWTHTGRTREATLVTDLVAALHTELGIDTSRVFVAGFSGGATMANALGCLLGPTALRGLGLHSGTLYSVDDAGGNPEFTYTGSGGVSCALPDAIFVWGQNDATSGVSFSDGQGVRDNYLATASCDATTTTAPITPCQSYDGCTHEVVWCPIPGMGHAIWSNAAEAMGDFWQGLP